MANKSNWKGLEKKAARLLGGKRRFRTTENYGKIADDVKFSKEMIRKFPILKTISVECKKRSGKLPIHTFFEEAVEKYGKKGEKNLVFVSQLTRQRRTLVTVDAQFFKTLWYSWLWKTVRRFPRTRKK